MTYKEENSKENLKKDEIDLIEVAKTLWEGRRIIIKTVIIFFFIGLFIALFSEKEYTATTTMVPQINNPGSKLGGLSSLASLAGFNLDMNSAGYEISPVLYPQIVSSVQFQLEIMNQEYEFEEVDDKISLFEYYKNYYHPGLLMILKDYTIGLPGLILKNNTGKKTTSNISTNTGTFIITREQEDIRRIIDEKLKLEINEKEGYLTLTSSFHQSVLSAQIAEKAQYLLQEYITKFKIEKANSQLSFIQERYNETKKEFEVAQTKLAAFRDANRNITSAVAQTELEKLENEYQLAFEVYSELAKQLEQARIKVKEETPVFSVIQEVVIPIERSKPKRMMILILWIILGVIIGVALIGGKTFINSIQDQWQNLNQKTKTY